MRILFGMSVVLYGVYVAHWIKIVSEQTAWVLAAVAVVWMFVNCARRLPHHTPTFVIYGRLWLLCFLPWWGVNWLVRQATGNSFTTGHETAAVAYVMATGVTLVVLVAGHLGHSVMKSETTIWMRSHGWHPGFDNEFLMPWPINPDSTERRWYGLTDERFD